MRFTKIVDWNDTTINYPKYLLSVSIVIFTIGSTLDIITTYMGLTSGFQEQTAFVDYLWVQYGLMGLILSKVVALMGLIISIIPAYVVFNKEIYKISLSNMYIIGGLYFTYAAIHNIMLMNVI